MDNATFASLKNKSDRQLAELIAGCKPGNEKHILGMAELDRRQNLGSPVRRWIAIGISLIALAVSVITLVVELS